MTRTGKSPIFMAKQGEMLSAVIEKMREKNISQLPVSDSSGWIKGVINESSILSAL